MRYYCNICKKDITKAEFLFSLDKFDKPLCREHQQIERNKQFMSNNEIQQTNEKPLYEETNNIEALEKITSIEDDTDTKKPLWKKALTSIGRGIVKGTKSLVAYSKEKMQIRRWKEQILREMTKGQLIQLCYKYRISTFTNYTETKYRHNDDLVPDFIRKQRKSTYDELISRLRNRLSLKDLISFAKSRNVPIRNILIDIEKWKANKEIKEMIEKGEPINTFYQELLEAIQSFKAFRKYSHEEGYQIDLARYLKSMFPNTDIEETRSSTRPDIITRGIAIEVKGPTFHHDLQTISDKCMRYTQHYPKGMIVVLFDISVTQRLFDDFIKGMEHKYPEVKVLVLSA